MAASAHRRSGLVFTESAVKNVSGLQPARAIDGRRLAEFEGAEVWRVAGEVVVDGREEGNALCGCDALDDFCFGGKQREIQLGGISEQWEGQEEGSENVFHVLGWLVLKPDLRS